MSLPRGRETISPTVSAHSSESSYSNGIDGRMGRLAISPMPNSSLSSSNSYQSRSSVIFSSDNDSSNLNSYQSRSICDSDDNGTESISTFPIEHPLRTVRTYLLDPKEEFILDSMVSFWK